ncbi:MAG: ArsR/SmtB family transcription factor [Phycisphaerales bacterium]
MQIKDNPPRPETPADAGNRPGLLDGLLDAALFKALADPTRAKLVACIARCGRGCSVKEVSACCTVDTSVVSRHLTLLESAGVLSSERDGRVVRYQARYADVSAVLRDIADALEACVLDDAVCCGDNDGCC